jgi:hypothetical protein
LSKFGFRHPLCSKSGERRYDEGNDVEKAKAAAASQCPRPKKADSEARLDAGIDMVIKAIARTRDASCAPFWKP